MKSTTAKRHTTPSPTSSLQKKQPSKQPDVQKNKAAKAMPHSFEDDADDLPTVYNVAQNYNMKVTRASQGMLLTHAKLVHNSEAAERSGVCWEVCRQWVVHRASNTWEEGETIYDIMSPDSEKVEELIKRHVERNDTGIEGNYKVENLPNETQMRTYGCCGATNLNSRAAILDEIFAHPAIYILNFAKGTSGHAIAFDTRGDDDKIIIMDPNFGEFITDSKSIDEFRSFFSDFWDASSYKNTYTNGDRELTKYYLAE